MHLLVDHCDSYMSAIFSTTAATWWSVAVTLGLCLLGPPQLNDGDDTIPDTRQFKQVLIPVHHMGTILVEGDAFLLPVFVWLSLSTVVISPSR